LSRKIPQTRQKLTGLKSEAKIKPVRIHQKEAETISWIFYQLRSLYGKKSWKKEKDLLGLLLRTILSQNTNDRNRDRAYQSLRQKFRPAGLSRQKSRRIKEILKKIQAEQGKLDLSFLARLPEKQAKKYLLSFKGIGEKTASIILLFGLGKNFFPVDTHILRVSSSCFLVWGKISSQWILISFGSANGSG